MCVYIYIYIYIHLSLSIYIYIYIYIHTVLRLWAIPQDYGPPEYGRSCDYSEQVTIIAHYSL